MWGNGRVVFSSPLERKVSRLEPFESVLRATSGYSNRLDIPWICRYAHGILPPNFCESQSSHCHLCAGRLAMGVEPKVCFFCVEPNRLGGLLSGFRHDVIGVATDGRGHQDGHIATECPRNPESWCYDRSVCCSECPGRFCIRHLSPIFSSLTSS